MTQHTEKPPLPKYRKIAEHFREQMRSGALKPGDRLPSLTEMRAQYGASRPTTDKVHAILQQDGLIARQHGSGTFVLQPRRTATGIIGLSGPGFSFKGHSSYWLNIMAGICDAAEQAGTPLMILGHESSQGWEKVDGILISDWQGSGALRHLPPDLPRVSVLAPFENIASVSADDYAGVRDATQHLIKLGHRRIGYMHALEHQALVPRRLAGYRDALLAAGVEPQENWTRTLRGRYDVGVKFATVGRRNMTSWLGDGWRETGCTALLCHNDDTALGAIAALREAGLDVPRAVSVVGFDGTETGAAASPSLATVTVPLRAIGATAVETLLRQIANDKVSSEQHILPTQFQPGASCARLPIKAERK